MKRTTKQRALTLASILFGAAVMDGSYAAPVRVDFSGNYKLAGSSAFISYFGGTNVTGSLTYETGSTGSRWLSIYDLTGFSVEVQGVAEGEDPSWSATAGRLTITNDNFGEDTYVALSNLSHGLSGSTPPVGAMSSMEFRLIDKDKSAFSSTDAPTSLTLAMFETAEIELSNSGGNVIYDIVWLQATAVPLPATVWMFSSAVLGGVGLLGFRRSRGAMN